MTDAIPPPAPWSTPAAARWFAYEWIDAWNAHDLPRILSHYRDDFEMRSPLIVERMGIVEGVLRGKAAIGPYWSIGCVARAAGLYGDPP